MNILGTYNSSCSMFNFKNSSNCQAVLKLVFPHVIYLRDHTHLCDLCSLLFTVGCYIHKIIIMLYKIPRNLTVILTHFLLNPTLRLNIIF